MRTKTRFHKLTAWILTLAMLMTFIPSFTLTAGALDHSDHYSCGVANCTADHGHTNVTSWTAWNAGAITYDADGVAYVYVTADCSFSGITVPEGKKLYLCLNGKTITSNFIPFTVESGAELHICDCAGGGVIENTSDTADGIDDLGGTVNIYGGTLNFAGSQGIDTESGSTVNIYGGALNCAGSQGIGGGGTVNIYGGSISAQKYGIISSGTVTITGSPTITGTETCGIRLRTGTLTVNGISYEAGNYNVVNDGGSASLKHVHNWSYRVPSDDKATIKALCEVTCPRNGETITIVAPAKTKEGDGNNANASIQDNKTSIGGVESLPAIQYQTKSGEEWGTATTIAPTTAGTYRASITVVGEMTYTAYVEYTIAAADTGHSSHYSCGVANCTADHGHTNVTSWTKLTNDNLSAITDRGNFYLGENISITETINIGAYDTVNLCLNGYTITNSSDTVFQLKDGSKFSVCDCRGGGRIESTSASESDSGIATDRGITPIVVNIYGGTVASTSGYGVYNDKAILNLYDGTVTGGWYGIRNFNGGTVNISGGSVSATGTYGCGVDNNSTMTISGSPTITGTVASIYRRNGCTITVADGSTGKYTVKIQALLSEESPSVVLVSGADRTANFESVNSDREVAFDGTNTVVRLKPHSHSWTYTAAGDTITAICIGNIGTCPDAEQSIMISAVGKLYDGTPVTATLDGSIDGVTVSADDITYSGNTDVGTYTASITVGGVTASVVFEITPVTYTVTVTDDGNGTASASPASGAEGTEVTLSATPNEGYRFKEWQVISGGVTVTDNKFTIGTENVEIKAIFEESEYITIKIQSPRGMNEEIRIDSALTVGDLKARVASVAGVTFGDNSEYRLFGGDLSYPNSKLDVDTKILKDIGFADGQTVHLEKSTNWDASGSEPIKIFGLTITGGKGSQEPYGDYNNVDYYWNYYYKTITIKSTAAITISGTGEHNTNIIIKNAGSSSYTNLTISDLHLTTDAGACINVQSDSWVKLTVNGNNTLNATGEAAQYTVDKMPALTLTNSDAYLKIMKASTGTLTATTSIEGQPGIGTYDSTSEVWGVEINGGTIIANGGTGSAGIRASAVCVYDGNVTANGGIDAYSSGNAIYPSPIEILGGTVIANAQSGAALTKVPELSGYKYYTATASANFDGSDAVTYDNAENDTYKYFKIEPRNAYNYDITVASTEGGTASGGGSYVENTSVMVTATANDGYKFVKWTENGTEVSTDASYTFTATGNRNLTAEFVEKTIISIPDITSEAYNGSVQTASVPANEHYTVKANSGGTNVGEYDVVLELTDSENYKWNTTNEKTVTLKFNITKAQAVISVDDTPIVKTYGETWELPEATTNFGTVSVDKTVADMENVGNYTVTYKVEGTNNFNGDIKTVSVTINPKPITGATVGDFAELTYTGQALTPSATVTIDGLTVTGTWSDVTNAYDKTTFTANGNFTGTITDKETGMAKADPTYTAPTIKTGLVYNGLEQVLLNEGTAEGGTMKYFIGGMQATETVTTRTSAGEYKVTCIVVGDENHKNVVVGEYTVTIAKKTIDSTITLEAPVRGKEPQTEIIGEGYTATISWLPNVKKRFAAATEYTATITVTPDENHTTAGIEEDGYTVSGAKTVSNAENGNVITVTYEKTDKTSSGSGGGGASLVTGGGTSPGTGTEKPGTEVPENPKPEKEEQPDTPGTVEKAFEDVHFEGHWSEEDVDYVYENKLMNGISETHFAPDASLTRAMLVTILYRLEGEPGVNRSNPFADVDVSAYYADAVIWGKQNGIIKGYSDTEFRPDEEIIREQIAAIMFRYAQHKNMAPEGAWAIRLEYTDLAEISEYATEGVMYCTLKGIMEGRGENTFAPKGYATRAEAAAILHRFVETNK